MTPLSGMPDGVWTRDEIGEYHDGRGNLIHQAHGEWLITLAGQIHPLRYRGKTLKLAKLKVEEVTDV